MLDAPERSYSVIESPMVVTLFGCLVLVGACLLVPRLLPPQPYNVLLIGGVGLGVLLWAIGLILSIRHAPLVWKAGSLIALMGVGALTATLSDNQFNARDRVDPSSFAELEFSIHGGVTFPQNASKRGPVSRGYAENMRDEAAARQAYNDAVGKRSSGSLNSPYVLSQNLEAIADCSAYDGLRALAEEQAQASEERSEQLLATIDAAAISDPLKDPLRAIAKANLTERVRDNRIEAATAGQQLCRLLAKRTWHNDNGYFGFSSASDLALYRRLQEERNMLAGNAEQIDRDLIVERSTPRDVLRGLLK